MTRSIVVTAGLALAAGLAAPAFAGAPGTCVFFDTKSDFDAFNQQDGKLLKGIEDFEESNIPDGGKVPLPGPFQGNVPMVDINGIGFPTGLTEKNLIIQDNITPGPAPLSPNPSGSPVALYVVGNSFINANSKKVGEDLEILTQTEASVDLIFTSPNKTGVGFELSFFDGFGTTFWEITVYDQSDNIIGSAIVNGSNEPVKAFFGVWCDSGIGRINIWDEGIIPDAVDNIQMWEEGQEPSCPWDCGIPHNKVVDVIDLLALLAQYDAGSPINCTGGTCDFNGDGCVDVVDLLKLLGQWGQACPPPPNDECAGKIHLTRSDPAGQIIEHFDMYGATPSPEPLECFGLANNPFKDIWYCLRNVTMTEKLVTLTGTVNLSAEVRLGCQCSVPPGPLVACGLLIPGTTFPMLPGDEVCIRLINDLNLPNDLIKGDLVIINEPIGGDPVNFFNNPNLYFEAVFNAGKVEKLFWDFKPSNPYCGPLDSPLDIFTHGLMAVDPWTGPAGEDFWPPFVDNLQFVPNFIPQGPFQPAFGPNFLGFSSILPSCIPDIDNNFLHENIGSSASFDIISGPPSPDDNNHTAIAFEVMSVYGVPTGTQPVVLHITVYDKNEQEIGKYTLNTFNGFKNFVGVLSKDPALTIGRIDIWDSNGGHEGISAIWAFNQPIPAGCDNCDDGSVDQCNTDPVVVCHDCETDDGQCVCVAELDCAIAQPCPVGAVCPAGFFCCTNTCCGQPVCLPLCTVPVDGKPAPAVSTPGQLTSGHTNQE